MSYTAWPGRPVRSVQVWCPYCVTARAGSSAPAGPAAAPSNPHTNVVSRSQPVRRVACRAMESPHRVVGAGTQVRRFAAGLGRARRPRSPEARGQTNVVGLLPPAEGGREGGPGGPGKKGISHAGAGVKSESPVFSPGPKLTPGHSHGRDRDV